MNPTHSYTMNDYQADASTTAFYKYKVIYPVLGLASEAGEVAGKLKKLIRDADVSFGGKVSLNDMQRADLAKELGDVLWYVSMAAKDIGVSLNDIAHINIEKLASRDARGKLGGSGDDR